MLDRTWNRLMPVAALALAAATMPAYAGACCPSGGNGSALTSATGLGESDPAAVNVSTDPSWAVYQFERDGVHYTQINDANGVVRAAIGNIGLTAWVLPLGRDVDRVRLPGDRIPQGVRVTIFKSPEVEVTAVKTTTGIYWVVSTTETAG
jgi:hypothetical protein